MVRARALGAAAVCALACAHAADAGMISYTDLTEGQSVVNLNVGGVAVTVTAAPRAFKHKSVAGVPGAGVQGGAVNGEIDDVESITFEFAVPITVTSIDIALLYIDGSKNDIGNEAAIFRADGVDHTLQVLDATNASWTGLGAASNTSNADSAGAGWNVSGADIFGQTVSTLVLLPGNAGSNATFGDYTFGALTFVPTPGAGALLAGALCLGARRRRA